MQQPIHRHRTSAGFVCDMDDSHSRSAAINHSLLLTSEAVQPLGPRSCRLISMKTSQPAVLTLIVFLAIGFPLAAEWSTSEKVDLDAVYRIKDEGMQRSKVMEIESWLTDVYGQRMTYSRNIREGVDWESATK